MLRSLDISDIIIAIAERCDSVALVALMIGYITHQRRHQVFICLIVAIIADSSAAGTVSLGGQTIQIIIGIACGIAVWHCKRGQLSAVIIRIGVLAGYAAVIICLFCRLPLGIILHLAAGEHGSVCGALLREEQSAQRIILIPHDLLHRAGRLVRDRGLCKAAICGIGIAFPPGAVADLLCDKALQAVILIADNGTVAVGAACQCAIAGIGIA